MLSVMILSVSVGDVFIESDDIKTVHATALAAGAGLTASTLFQICLFVGVTVVGVYAIGEVIDNQDEIAHAGKNFIDSVTELPDGWVFNMTDASGQDYVFGSEALQLVQDTSWEVIQGGSPNNNDDDNNDDDDDEDKEGWLKLPTSADELLASFTALGATWFYDAASKLYQKWVNGEELTEEEAAVLDPLISGTCDQYDIARQWSGALFDYSASFSFSGDWGTYGRYTDVDDFSLSHQSPIACVYYPRDAGDGVFDYQFKFFSISSNMFNTISFSDSYRYVGYGGAVQSGTKFSTGVSHYVGGAYYTNASMAYSSNFPVFSSAIAAENYLRGTGAVTDALNYARTYQNADWLSEDWAGILIDPLCNIGLSLSQLIALAKALGIHTVSNDLSPEELADLIKRSLPAVNPELLPDTPTDPVIVPDPGKDPIYFPSPGAHPLPTPAPDPGTDPDPGTGTDPGTDPDPGADPDIDASDYKVDLRGIFPFCIPFDFIALLNVLDADPVAPCFRFPVVIPALNYEETVELDMSVFDDVAKVIRICEKVSFLIFLMFATSKVIRW